MANGIRLSINAWTYQDFIDFTRAVQTGDNSGVFDLATQIIISWDYPVDLAQPEPLMELGVIESGKVISTIFERLNLYIDELEIDDVRVDFSKWNTRKFLEFDTARREGKIAKAEKMLREIVTFVGREQRDNGDGTFVEVATEESPRYSFEDGAKAFKAVNEAYKKLVTGKN